ncbi:hypothetical protein HG537_0A09040 [Torulaspora globosa]|uniref:CobW C-terminal domain-containing protein n=1 Tax=Torulaspora globosa TaxID=48254 RepID=A0A7H9HN06_9SACH|nr:hypothetical protein HG537_0A09040 [Torulaspora sp. CBS 2947]
MTTSSPKPPVPVTILSGFLGSGKTTLLERILTGDNGLKIAVIINDMSQLNIDASLIRNHKVSNKEEKLIQLQNGCICCTLRGDLLEELVSLHETGAFDYIVIESTGIAEPMQVAETFSSEFSQTLIDTPGAVTKDEEKLLKKVIKLGGLEKITKIDCCVTVVDAVNFLSNIETTDFLATRWGDSGQGESDRTVTDLMVDQIEFADIIIINKVSSIKKKKLNKIEKMIRNLNPVAQILRADYCNVPLNKIINTNIFDFERASTSAGWLQSINEMTQREGFGDKNRSVLTPKPETEEYGVNNFVYNSRKPFHPERLYEMLKEKFFIIEQTPLALAERVDEYEADSDAEVQNEQEEDEQEDEQDDEQELSEKDILKNKANSPFGPLLRSKGFFWLATRHIMRGEWSSAGPMLTLKGGIPWFDVTGFEDIPPETVKLIKSEFQGPYGDRRNELVFIGLSIDQKKLSDALDSCLLTDEEYEKFVEITSKEKNLLKVEEKLAEIFDDGFEDWIILDDDDDDEGKEEQEEEAQEKS